MVERRNFLNGVKIFWAVFSIGFDYYAVSAFAQPLEIFVAGLVAELERVLVDGPEVGVVFVLGGFVHFDLCFDL